MRNISQIRPSPENRQLYKPVSPKDPAVQALAKLIKKHGILEPIVITRDGYILSGHRRWVAAKIAGLKRVPVRVFAICRERQPAKFLELLCAFNGYRNKGRGEILREEVVTSDPKDPLQLSNYLAECADITVEDQVELREEKYRAGISAAKQPFLRAIQEVVQGLHGHWPLSVRQIHYKLLNDPPLKHAGKPDSYYRNDRASYQALVELTVRARLLYEIDWAAIDDETRPVETWDCHCDVQPFIRRELDVFLRDYRRDLMQSQPNHVEIVGEKLTIQSIIRPVAERFCIPYTIGRGFPSLPVRQQVEQRFYESGKKKLVLLFLTDHDPDGEEIVHSFARSMRDDFSIDPTAIKVALTDKQVAQFDLPADNVSEAKRSSSNYERFREEYGESVYELEAASPMQLQTALEEVIKSVIDVEAFNDEVAAEKKDLAFLAETRKKAQKALAPLIVKRS